MGVLKKNKDDKAELRRFNFGKAEEFKKHYNAYCLKVGFLKPP